MAALKPCGTSAAYRRHLRNGEDPCDACRAAIRQGKRERSSKAREADPGRRLAAVPDEVTQESPAVQPLADGMPDPLAIARDNLAIVEATLRSTMTPGGSIAGLTRRREELAEKILELSGAESAEVPSDDDGSADAKWTLEAI